MVSIRKLKRELDELKKEVEALKKGTSQSLSDYILERKEEEKKSKTLLEEYLFGKPN